MIGAARPIPEPVLRRVTRILLVKPSSLGDIVHALPVLHGLRRRFPTATIDWLAATPFVSFLQSQPALNGVVPFDRARFGRIGWSASATMAFVRFVRDLRSRRYDLVVDLQGLFRTGFLSWASGSKVRIGLDESREGAWAFYSHRIPIGHPDTHAVDRYYRVGQLLGFDDGPVQFGLTVAEPARAAVGKMLRRHAASEACRWVVIAPCARWETKVWPVDRFAQTVDALQAEDGVRCLLIGSTEEAERCRRIVDACTTEPIQLAGGTTLPQLVALMEQADVVLCHDSAAAHLAAALNRPLVCLAGPTNPKRTGPYRRLDAVVRLALDCSPCYLRRRAQCPHEHRCMEDLAVRDVLGAVRRALRNDGAIRHPPRGRDVQIGIG